jgi:hypothetical protein
MLSQLVYISARKPNCTEAEIDKILAACRINNKELDITGVLLYSDKQFVQYLEGDYSEIFGLYDKIKGDDRHKNIVLINSTPIKNRVFPSWQMGAKKVDFDSIEYRTQISTEDQQEFQRVLAGNESNRAVETIKKFFK